MRGLSAFAGIWGGKEKEALMAGCLSASLFFSCLFFFFFWVLYIDHCQFRGC